MKRFTASIMIMVVAMILIDSGMAFAEGTTATLSVKGWLNSWERKGTGETFKSDSSVLMLGPALNVKFDNFFLGAQYLLTTGDYEFTFPDEVDKISRKDMDLVAGYMFTPRFGAFIGYKSIKADVSVEDKIFGGTTDVGNFEMTGPGIGIMGNIPLSESIALYGTLSYMWMQYKENFTGSPTFEEDNPGASIEVGIAAAFTKSFSGNLGYKYQSFEGKTSKITDNFSGMTFGLNYTF
jgi:opacity protein-like surface antigen